MQINPVNEPIDINQVVPFFQPIVDLNSGHVIGYECLARLIRANEQLLLPAQFLNIVEKEACSGRLASQIFAQSADYFAGSKTPWGMNLCFSDIHDDHFLATLSAAVKYRHAPGQVTLELKTSDAEVSLAETRTFLKWCQQRGIHLVFDRFTPTPERLELIAELAVDGVKLDGKFVGQIDDNSSTEALMQQLRQWAQGLQAKVIAEHIETAEILACVKRRHIPFGQGFYFSQPRAVVSAP